jgi:hypothetical protein
MRYLLILALLLPVNLNATIRDVCASGCTYSTIATAIAAAATDDIIEIRDSGVYDEVVEPVDTITIRVQADQSYSPTIGSDGTNKCGIDLDGLATTEAVTVLGDGIDYPVTVRGDTHAVDVDGAGGNIWAEDCYFTRLNTGTLVHLTGSSDFSNPHVFKRCIFDANSQTGDLIGVTTRLTPAPNLKVYNCLFKNNASDTSDCIYINGTQTAHMADVVNCTLISAGDDGLDSDDPVTVVNTLFMNNATDTELDGDASVGAVSYSAFGTLTDLTGYGTGCVTVRSSEEIGITYDAVSSTSGEATTHTWNHTCSGDDRLLVVGIAVNVNTAGHMVSSVTYDGEALTGWRSDYVDSDISAFTAYKIAPSTGTNPVTVTLSDSRVAAMGAVSFNGVNQTTPTLSQGSNNGTGTTQLTTWTTSSDFSWLIDCVGIQADTALATVDSSQTSRFQEVYDAGATATSAVCGFSTKPSPLAGSLTMQWTTTPSVIFAICGGEVQAVDEYQLLLTADSVNAGTSVSALYGITTDLDGNARPIGSGWDIGAYENTEAPNGKFGWWW